MKQKKVIRCRFPLTNLNETEYNCFIRELKSAGFYKLANSDLSL